ncbi:CPBP family intramembrane glutamic endopeptidase [Lignipirellula cremea]|uniref:CAAX amino terminal protease self-immunity n=1 Tax=Lignipirellula cremea TaxID=2528010 RepID=A0A518DP56_9BACT|nr:type II CAAX endopeptidase family protein [Lignipirellula cremea]QDU93619.1 CAAX amino terminal protease self- immunity [Lignipirellula cremea]
MGRFDFFSQTWEQAEAEQRAFVSSPAAQRPDARVITVLLSAALVLSFQYYALGWIQWVWLLDQIAWFWPGGGEELRGFLLSGENASLTQMSYWALGAAVLYAAVPLLLIKVVLRENVSDYGLRLQGALSGWWIYLLMYLAILPAVLWASRSPAFQEQYPFYRPPLGQPLWPRFWIWQACYALQFVALEFFFRGYMLHGLRRRFGGYAILVMMVPYCMIHFGKPLRETLGAIGAGLILGFMSLKTRSIWLGAALHIAVALTMDFASLAQQSQPVATGKVSVQRMVDLTAEDRREQETPDSKRRVSPPTPRDD